MKTQTSQFESFVLDSWLAGCGLQEVQERVRGKHLPFSEYVLFCELAECMFAELDSLTAIADRRLRVAENDFEENRNFDEHDHDGEF